MDYLSQPPAWFNTRILVGPGAFLTPQFVEKHSITGVINCAFPSDSPKWYQDQYPHRYTCLGAFDNEFTDIIDYYPTFERTLRDYLRNTSGVIYVHCQAGINRSAFLALAYVCKNFGWYVDPTMVSLQRQRPCMFQNTTFKRQVKEFVNGHLSSEESTRIPHNRNDAWNTGLSSPGTGSNAERVIVTTVNPAARIGIFKGTGLVSLCNQQS